MIRSRRCAGVLLTTCMAAVACTDTPAAPPPVATALKAGALPMTAVVGSALVPSVEVLDDRGRPMPGVTVSFEITVGAGAVEAAARVTGPDGVASPGVWTLGTASGRNELTARAAALPPAVFAVDGTADTATSLELLPGAPDRATVGERLIVPGVMLSDRHGNPVAGVAVAFTAMAGTVASAPRLSDERGIATPGEWQLAGTAGPQSLHAAGAGLETLLTVAAVAGPPARLELLRGADQTALVATELPVVPAVSVSDSYGNVVADAPVSFHVASGGGSLPRSETLTDRDGEASVGAWRLGPLPGENTLAVTVPGVPPVLITATATAPPPPRRLQLLSVAGHDTSCPVQSSGCRFTVQVLSETGTPLPGEAVLWQGADGSRATTLTNQHGRATTSNLTVHGATGSYQQTASLAEGAELHFRYTVVAGGGYNIDIRFVGEVTAIQRAAFDHARARWEQVITGNLPSSGVLLPANVCGINHPAVAEVVDDLLIFVELVPIDGPGKVLGSAGPCLIRGSSSLPILGVIRLDTDDLASMEQNGTLRDVIMHEIGHVIGIGSLWRLMSLLHGAGTDDPYFSGARAGSGFVLGGGTLFNGVPVENTGGAGTRDSHWRESRLANELMTGYISPGYNPLSDITVGALTDMGYEVNFGAADTYSLPFAGLRALGVPVDPSGIELTELPLPPPRRIW